MGKRTLAPTAVGQVHVYTLDGRWPLCLLLGYLMSIHVIRCRKTGAPLAVKLDGGYCVCAAGSCMVLGEVPQVEDDKLLHDQETLSGAVRGS